MTTIATVSGPGRRLRRSRRARRPMRWIGLTLAFVLAFAFIFPLLWAILRSLQTSRSFLEGPTLSSLVHLTFSNYTDLLSGSNSITHYLVNSIVVSILTGVVTAVLAALAGYGFARFQFPLKGLVFGLLLMTLMVPFQALLAPLFITLRFLHLNNSLLGLALLYAAFQLPFGLFVMRTSFAQIPNALEEAAMVDGASSLIIFWRIMLPIVLPGVASVLLFTIVFAWNEFLGALTFLTTNSRFTLQVALDNLQTGAFGQVNFGLLDAGAVISMVPCLILFLALQRYYVNGLVSGAVK